MTSERHLSTQIEKIQSGVTRFDARNLGRCFLETKVESPNLDTELIIAYAGKISRLDVIANSKTTLNSDECAVVRDLLMRRASGEPIAYLISEKEFFGLTFKVTKDVLIPRPDTEILVESALASIKNRAKPLIIDVCTGSGCVGISIGANLEGAHVVATDISEKALAIAAENAQTLGQSIDFRLGNLLDPCLNLESVDLIVSNPPYIPQREMDALMRDVRDFEPHLALLGMGEDGLGFHCKIAEQGLSLLKPGGFLMMEIGAGQAESLSNMAFSGFSRVEFVNDYSGIPRVARYKKVSDING